ncbi:TetR/AcrR family transcriptional regulator [Yoonia sediminilitoris]|uniref:TetR family transcriptional regulator n=1 Tax=Yoonia sediminilitoris TaxID=1286148 RepID=A0A2T6KJZ3_9RHOB|nr:TetR/AcrR family transcriptional regulator [Yoonia sediminilitoris]PUB16271.1 TetR family transcriptional regulator [Yoonia sediminilitoris]RCW96620.1 TetR family transcriptional regulator [Yoonia sediminilitoris]
MTAPKAVRGSSRTSRADWTRAALDTLIEEGVDQVKVAVLSKRLKCARSSFYWYFKDRQALLGALLSHWQATNTAAIVTQATAPADSINLALVNLFACWIDGGQFDTQLDFAVRDWARRDGTVRQAVDVSDQTRIAALTAMFTRFDYPPAEAKIRARIVYFTQIGYDALDQRETNFERAQSGPDYLFCMTGHEPTPRETQAVLALGG